MGGEQRVASSEGTIASRACTAVARPPTWFAVVRGVVAKEVAVRGAAARGVAAARGMVVASRGAAARGAAV